MDPSEWLLIDRVVRFGDTDAAGVMHFHQLLRYCHEAYEGSLERFGIPACEIFPTLPTMLSATRGASNPRQGKSLGCGDSGMDAGYTNTPAATKESRYQSPQVGLPIVHCSADYRRPLVCGDRITIKLAPQQLDSYSFEIIYQFYRMTEAGRFGEAVAQGLTRHRTIDISNRSAHSIPNTIQSWLVASRQVLL